MSVKKVNLFFPLLFHRHQPLTTHKKKKKKATLSSTSYGTKSRSSHQRCSMKKGVLKNFSKFTGKHLCQSLFLNKVAGLRAATLLKKRLWHRCFSVNFAKFLRTPFYRTPLGDCFCKSNYKQLIREEEPRIIYLVLIPQQRFQNQLGQSK